MKHIPQIVFVSLLLLAVSPVSPVFGQTVDVNIQSNVDSESNSQSNVQSCIKVTINGKVEERCTNSSGTLKYESSNGESGFQESDTATNSSPSSSPTLIQQVQGAQDDIETKVEQEKKKIEEARKDMKEQKQAVKQAAEEAKFDLRKFIQEQIQKIRNLFTFSYNN